MPFPSIGGESIDFVQIALADKICTIINRLYSLHEKLTKVPPVMSKFWIFPKRANSDSAEPES